MPDLKPGYNTAGSNGTMFAKNLLAGTRIINGEMVVVDGGSHLRSSGAEDLLQWTEEQWQVQRAARSKS